MKKILLIIALIGLTLGALSQEDNVPGNVKKRLLNSTQNANSLGRFFAIAVPTNEDEQVNLGRQSLEIYIASSEAAIVTVGNPLTGASSQVVTKPGEITTIDDEQAFTWDFEIGELESGRAVPKAFIIQSTRPISVYVMNSKRTSTDGYLAIPVSLWGTSYTHCSFWDQREFNFRKTGGGFVVVAGEDDTDVEILLGGRNLDGTGQTHSGLTTGFPVEVNLDLGECYQILGNGETRGVFDLTGTKITATKPVGVISFQQRCLIPVNGNNNGRDHLITMMPAEKTWGKTYVSIETDRGTDMGDYYRVVVKEANTVVSCKWYDKASGAPISQYDFVVVNPLDFDEFSKQQGMAPSTNASIRGIVIFESDKPFHVQQYSYSARWDNQPDGYDPFMFPVVNADNFTNFTIFQTPSNNSPDNNYTDNYLNLIIKGSSDVKENVRLMESVKLDGEPLHLRYPIMRAGNKIPGTDFTWITVNPMTQGAHTLEAETFFGAYIYGFASFDSYAWPAATAYRDLSKQDTLPPVITSEEDCGFFKLTATEFRDSVATDNCGEEGNEPCPPQVDSHINLEPEIIENLNDNFAYSINWPEDERHDDNWFTDPEGAEEFIYTFDVVDRSQDARVIYAMIDIAGNIQLDTLEYFANKYEFGGDNNFGLIRRFDIDQKVITFTSTNSTTMEIRQPEMETLDENANFTMTLDPDIEWPLIIEPNQTIEINVTYQPLIEYLDATRYTADSDEFRVIGLPAAEAIDEGKQWSDAWDVAKIKLGIGCSEDSIYVYGRGGENWISVTDWPIATLGPLVEDQSVIRVTNWNNKLERRASWPLEITGIDLNNITDENGTVVPLTPFGVKDEFALLDGSGVFDNPITIDADNNPIQATHEFEYATFVSNDNGVFIRNVPFVSNAIRFAKDVTDTDSVSNWQREVTNSEIISYNVVWEKHRVGTSNQVDGTSSFIVDPNDPNNLIKGYIVIENISPNPASVTEIYFTPRGEDANNANKHLSISTDGTIEGEFSIMDNDPNNPDWANFVRFLYDGDIDDDVFEVPAQSTYLVPVQFNPQDQHIDANFLTETYEVSIVAPTQTPGEFNRPKSRLSGETYLPIISTTNGILNESILLGNQGQLQIEIENIGTNFELEIYGVQQDNLIDWTGDVNSGKEFIFDAANSDFNPIDIEANGGSEVLAVGDVRILSFIYTPAAGNITEEDLARIPFRHNGNRTTANEPSTNDVVERADGLTTTVGNTPNPPANEFDDVSFLTARGKSTQFSVNGIRFEELIECNDSELQPITLINDADTDLFTITRIGLPNGVAFKTLNYFTFYSDDQGNQVIDPETDLAGQTIPQAGGQLTIYVRFSPERMPEELPKFEHITDFVVEGTYPGENNTTIEVSEQRTIETTYFNGALEFDIADITGGEVRLEGDLIINTQANLNFGISMTNVSQAQNPEIDEVTYEKLTINEVSFILEYWRTQLELIPDVEGFQYTLGNALDAGWVVNFEELPDRQITTDWADESKTEQRTVDVAQIRITISNPDPNAILTRDGLLFYPHFRVLLDENPNVTLTMEPTSVDLATQSDCITYSTDIGTMNVEDCIQEYRAVEVSTFRYDFDADVTTSTLDIDYEVALDYDTKIEIVDMNGNIVATPVDGFVNRGTYSVSIPLTDLNTGAHFIRITSLEYQNQAKVMIVK